MKPNVLAISFLFPNASNAGYGVFVLNRLKAVQDFCKVKVIAPVQWYPFINRIKGTRGEREIPAQETIDGVETFHPRFAVVPRYLKWIDSLTYLWAAARTAAKLRKRFSFEFDLVDVHWTYPDLLAGYWLARRNGKKYVVTIRGHEAFYDEEWSIRRWIVATLIRKADYIVALSAELRDKAVRLGARPDAVRVVLNGVDLKRFRYLPQEECRRKLGLTEEGKILLCVGRLTERKGHHELIRMLPELKVDRSVALFLIGGVNREENYGPALERLIAELKLTNVHMIDRVPHADLLYWYGAADLFCLATASEGSPNVIMEALACGLPVVSTNAGAIEEVVKNGENGFVLDDVKTLGQAVQNGLTRHWDRKEIAANMGSWSWACCARQVAEVYRALLPEAR